MADSNITRRALASALKELMQDTPFQKISVADICEACNMSRKSFYYHFRDKYDLMNWIFDMDFIHLINRYESDDTFEGVTALANVLYENRRFYRNALSVQGQNSLSDHIREIVLPILRQRLTEAFRGKDSTLYLDFFVDAIISALLYWIKEEDCKPPEEYLPDFMACVVATSEYICKKYTK